MGQEGGDGGRGEDIQHFPVWRPCTLDPRCRAPARPRTTLKEIPLHEVPGDLRPEPAGRPSYGAAHNPSGRGEGGGFLNL